MLTSACQHAHNDNANRPNVMLTIFVHSFSVLIFRFNIYTAISVGMIPYVFLRDQETFVAAIVASKACILDDTRELVQQFLYRSKCFLFF